MKKIILVIILLLIFIPAKINAESFREGEYIPDTYIKKFKGSTGKYEQMVVFRRNSDNKVVYCIELWESLSSGKNLPSYTNNPKTLINMDDAVWERIRLLAYYGYGYKNHTDIKWYAITQMMIWKTTSPESDIYFTDTLNGNRVDKYINEENEIDELINKHKRYPTTDLMYTAFYNQTYNYVDKNNLINDYEITNIENGLTVTRPEPTKINVNDTYIGFRRITLTNKDKLYNNAPTLYYDSDGQDVLLPGSYDPLEFRLVFSMKSRDITINKIDSDTGLNVPSGDASFNKTKFEIYDLENNLYKTVETNENGQVVLKNFPYGKFKIKEEKAGVGYTINNELTEIYVNSSYNSFDIKNKVIKNKIIINKYLKDHNNLIKENARFIVLDKNNNEVESFETNNGYYELELPYGTYTLKQITGTKNYKNIDDITINVVEDNKIQELNLYNLELTVPIKIINTDKDSNLNILESGATFTIKNLDTLEEIKLTTNNNGETITINLTPGIYEIIQDISVKDYILNEEIINLEINDDNFTYDNNVYEVIVPNEKEKSDIEVDKLIKNYFNDELIDTKKESNIDVSIYAKDDIYTKDGLLVYTKDEEIKDKKLVYGNYYMNNPINNEVVDIVLNNANTKKIEILEENYKYSKTINDVPNTYINEKKKYIDFILISLGLIFVYRGKHEEN